MAKQPWDRNNPRDKIAALETQIADLFADLFADLLADVSRLGRGWDQSTQTGARMEVERNSARSERNDLIDACEALLLRLRAECECDPEECPDCYDATQGAVLAIDKARGES